MRNTVLFLSLMLLPIASYAKGSGFFVGYELFEMSMNKFENFAGELGYRFDDENQLRLTIMEVRLTERHLSNDLEAAAIKGDNVKGYFQGYELHYDTFFSEHWYYSYAAGYYNDLYEHTESMQKIDNSTATLGGGVGYQYRNLFGHENLYVNFNIPIRYYFDSIKETKLGDATVREHKIVSNLWLFVGLQF